MDTYLIRQRHNPRVPSLFASHALPFRSLHARSALQGTCLQAVVMLATALPMIMTPPVTAGEAEQTPALVPQQPIDIDDPPAGIFADEWYAVMLNGHKCGQMRVRMERIAREPQDVIQTQTRMRMTIRRDAVEVPIGVAQKTIESLDGRPLSFSRTMYLGQQPVVTEGTIQDGQVTIRSKQMDQEMPPKTYKLPEGALLDWGVFREQFKHGLAPGTKYDLPLYEPSVSPDRLCETTVEIIGPELIDLFGRLVPAIKTQQVMRIPSMLGQEVEQKTTAWVTAAGQALKLQMSVMDIPIEVLACSEAVAMADDDPAELTINMLVELNRAVPAERASQVTYRMTLKKASSIDKLPEIPETAIQKVERRNDREQIITVTRTSALPESDARVKMTEEERAQYTAATAMLNHEDPKIREMADHAAGKETDPRKLASLFCDYVHHQVHAKNLSVGFATASEVARTREGDCTEHGVLLAALGRTRGIPTRMVTGLVYAPFFGGKFNVLVGHLWTQFWLDGRWVDLDAALGQTDVDPTHIAMAFAGGTDAGLADLVTSTWLSLGQFVIDVVKVEQPAGQ